MRKLYVNSEQALDSVFLSYDKILKKLHLHGLTTKQGKEITELDLRKAIDVMLEKHPTCRWRSEKIRSRKYFILIEGYYWLVNVYFQKEKALIDADISFFEDRIKLYEELLKAENNQNWWNEDMDIKQDELCFDLGLNTLNVTLLANSKEQICVEKIKSLLKFGITSTRYKDVFDIYYLINTNNFDKIRFINYLDKFVFKDSLIGENNLLEIKKSLSNILSNSRFKLMLNMAKNNWTELPVENVITIIIEFLTSLELVEV